MFCYPLALCCLFSDYESPFIFLAANTYMTMCCGVAAIVTHGSTKLQLLSLVMWMHGHALQQQTSMLHMIQKWGSKMGQHHLQYFIIMWCRLCRRLSTTCNTLSLCELWCGLCRRLSTTCNTLSLCDVVYVRDLTPPAILYHYVMWSMSET